MTEITQDEYAEVMAGAILESGAESYQEFQNWMNANNFGLPVGEGDYELMVSQINEESFDKERAKAMYQLFRET